VNQSFHAHGYGQCCLRLHFFFQNAQVQAEELSDISLQSRFPPEHVGHSQTQDIVLPQPLDKCRDEFMSPESLGQGHNTAQSFIVKPSIVEAGGKQLDERSSIEWLAQGYSSMLDSIETGGTCLAGTAEGSEDRAYIRNRRK